MTAYEELKARGLIAQVTNEEEINKDGQRREGRILYRFRSNRGQPARRTFYGACA